MGKEPVLSQSRSAMDLLATLEQALQTAALSDCPSIIGQLEALKATLWARLVHPNGMTSQPVPTEYLTVEQVCKEFHVTPEWLYRHKRKLPHSQPTRKQLIFPATALRRWFAARKST